MELCDRSVEPSDRTCRVFPFTVRGKLQTACTSEGFHIGNAYEYHFMSARLQTASKRGHGIQVTDNWHTDETDLHGRYLPTPRPATDRGNTLRRGELPTCVAIIECPERRGSPTCHRAPLPGGSTRRCGRGDRRWCGDCGSLETAATGGTGPACRPPNTDRRRRG